MKIYSIICDLNKPILKQVTVAPYSQFKLALKAVKNGTELSPDEISIDGYDADEELYHGFKTFPFTSETSDLVLNISVENQKFEYVIRVSDATVFDMTPGSKYQIQTLDVTENGTYDTEGKAYTPVTVRVGIPELDCSNYVQDHLVHQYDVYENGGKNVHKVGIQPEIIDLAGDADMTTTKGVVVSDCFTSVKESPICISNGSIIRPPETLECVLKWPLRLDAISNGILMTTEQNGIRTGMGFFHYSTTGETSLLTSFNSSRKRIRLSDMEPISDGKHTFTLVYNSSAVDDFLFYLDGKLVENPVYGNTISLAPASDISILGAYMNGVVTYTFRFYDKALTAEEVAANAEIDKQRFNF